MKPTKIWSLLVSIFIAGVITFIAVKALVANGGSVPVAPNNLLISIPSIAVIELLAAIPVFRYRRELAKYVSTGKRPKRIDPFYAVRVLALAKATAISGSLFAGFAASLVILQVTLPVTPDSISLNVFALVESVLLIVVAFIIERSCKLPDDGDTAEQKPATRPEATPA
ncbi:MAG: hypothetical protein RL319_1065 [Actinomycetota bacterium]|jgi:hypothetical protein